MIEITFNNSDAVSKFSRVYVTNEKEAIEVVNWYSAFYASDTYTVTIYGIEQKLDIDGRILNGEICSEIIIA